MHNPLKRLLGPLYVRLGRVHPLYRFIWSQKWEWSVQHIYSGFVIVACLKSLYISDHWHRLTNWTTALWLWIGHAGQEEFCYRRCGGGTKEAQVCHWTQCKLLNVYTSSMYTFMQHIEFTSNIIINFNNYKYQSQDPISFSFSILTPLWMS